MLLFKTFVFPRLLASKATSRQIPSFLLLECRCVIFTSVCGYVAHFCPVVVSIQGGGGPIAVLALDKPGRFDTNLPTIAGHSGPVLDMEFNPFDDYMIATGSEDSTIKVWSIPEEGVTEMIKDPLVELNGHTRKVTLMRFHPTASNVLASTSADQTVKVWDITKGCELSTLSGAHDQLINELIWDFTGSQYVTSSKDKHIRFMDGRQGSVSNIIEHAHEGSKTIKLANLGSSGKFLSVGFTRESQRQLKIWDPRNSSTEVVRLDMDQAAGVIMPFFDPDTNVIYLAGKGDGNVRCYEVTDNASQIYSITDFRTNVSAKGMAFVPKRGLNILGNETARLLKLTPNNSVEPLSFVVPRKSEGFQEDIFPDTASGEAAHTADEWLAGSELPPKTVSLNPCLSSTRSPTPSSKTVFSFKTIPILTAELAAAQQRIEHLEAKLREANISID
jgi:coronin-1B/1C/6